MKDERMITKSDFLGMKFAIQARRQEQVGLLRGQQRTCSPLTCLESFDDLLQRDEQREKDGFSKKIKFRRMPAGPGKIISIPYVEEEKLIHGEFEPEYKSDDEDLDEEGDIDEMPGHGEGEEGEVIGEMPITGKGEGEGDERQAGEDPGDHGIEEKAYQKGKELSEKYELPNLKDKGKKVPTDEYTYDLTDRHRGSGQFLDRRETLRSVVKTNAVLGRIDKNCIDISKMVVGPNDRVYRVLSKEKVWKSRAIVFFARDYSGSMWGEPTRIIVEQHMMIYAWLTHQYESLVIPRFFVHDTKAKEVSAREYFGLSTGGGTFIPSVYQEITKTVEGEALARDYNIFVFQGTDGDDWDDGSGRTAIPEIEKILEYVNRMGVCVLKHPYYGDRKSIYEQYLEKSDLLRRRDVFRVCLMSLVDDVTEDENIEAIKVLIAQD